jgi:hypothetical protein
MSVVRYFQMDVLVINPPFVYKHDAQSTGPSILPSSHTSVRACRQKGQELRQATCTDSSSYVNLYLSVYLLFFQY